MNLLKIYKKVCTYDFTIAYWASRSLPYIPLIISSGDTKFARISKAAIG